MEFTFISAQAKTPIEKISLNENATLLLGDGYLPPLNLNDELTGASNFIKALCVLSRKKNNLILAGCKLFCKGKTFWGTLVVENGKFLGISDMVHSIDNSFDESCSIRVFETGTARLGVVSGDDINFFEVSRIMRLWECDLLVFSIRGRLTRAHRVLSEAQSISNGVTAVCFASDKVFVAGAKNRMVAGNNVYLNTKSSDTLIKSRRPQCYVELVRKPSL